MRWEQVRSLYSVGPFDLYTIFFSRSIAAKLGQLTSLLFGLLGMIACATLYAFSLYAPFVKSSLGLDQKSVNLIGASGNVGNYLGLPLGLTFDLTGPRPTGLIAGCLLGAGYGITYLRLIQAASFPWYFICIMFFFIGQGSHACYTLNIFTNVRNFLPTHRGKIIGVLASFYGLSPAVFGQIFLLFFTENVTLFLLFCAITTSCLTFMVAGMVQLKPPYFLVSSPAVLSTTSSSEHVSLSSPSPSSIALETVSGNDADDDLESVELHPIVEGESDAIITLQGTPNNSLSTDYHVGGMLQNLSFYLLFFSFCIATGCGLMYINNLGSLILSRGGSKEMTVIAVICYSISGAAGRFLAGAVSDILGAYVSRAFFFAIAVEAMVLSLLCTILPFPSIFFLYVGILAVGFVYGSLFSLCPSLVGDIFGVRYLGSNWGVVTSAPALGSLLFNTLAGAGYDYFAERDRSGELTCGGWKCYGYVYLLSALLCQIAMIAAILLSIKESMWWKRSRQNSRFLPWAGRLLEDSASLWVRTTDSDGEAEEEGRGEELDIMMMHAIEKEKEKAMEMDMEETTPQVADSLAGPGEIATSQDEL